jgi:hypothetical protein
MYVGTENLWIQHCLQFKFARLVSVIFINLCIYVFFNLSIRFDRDLRRTLNTVCTEVPKVVIKLKIHVFFVSPVALRHRNKDPAPFRHPVDVFSSFCPIVWQHFARHCRQLRSAYFYAPITWVNSISLLKTYALAYILPKTNNKYAGRGGGKIQVAPNHSKQNDPGLSLCIN